MSGRSRAAGRATCDRLRAPRACLAPVGAKSGQATSRRRRTRRQSRPSEREGGRDGHRRSVRRSCALSMPGRTPACTAPAAHRCGRRKSSGEEGFEALAEHKYDGSRVPIWDDVISAGERRAYEKAGWGGRVGFGQRPALLVTDMYRAFVDPAYPFSSETSVETASQIRILLEAFRRRSLPVFFSTERPAQNAADRGRWKVKAADGAQMTEAAAYEIWPDIAPVKGESVLVKTYPSAFFGTTLS